MKRILAISDIHGCYDEFNKLLDVVRYDSKNDRLILLGDYTDRGDQSKEVIEMLIQLNQNEHVICLRGNHDQMLLDWLLLDDPKKRDHYFRCGGEYTVKSYCHWFDQNHSYDDAKEYILKNYDEHIKFLSSLPLYYETETHIFVHAGVSPDSENDNWKEQPMDTYIWLRDEFFNNALKLDKTVVFGHTPLIDIHGSHEIWFADRKIGIDGSCCFGLQLNCLEIAEDGYKTYSVSKQK
ncbi:metallophosphoesterase family protein [Chengkuizengella axinellae]|uniref:Metallophosphoesterase family protein n=1 Tax=Chengkuizengella axinellae TaxID=3064388 RepID=A0ABT9IXZ3_9BACL|nr:metallophosphoesterase family protein [Chengkuizengella sp. 2205SS18-9]MDP5274234.1 metallophosphoesterase family protein [Chengkuizengella sp. 2205SS18-9]